MYIYIFVFFVVIYPYIIYMDRYIYKIYIYIICMVLVETRKYRQVDFRIRFVKEKQTMCYKNNVFVVANLMLFGPLKSCGHGGMRWWSGS